MPFGVLGEIRLQSCLWLGCPTVLRGSEAPSQLDCTILPGVSVATCTAILHVGGAQQVRTGSTSAKEDDYESDAATIVQKCVSQVSAVPTPLPWTVFLRGTRPRCLAYLFPYMLPLPVENTVGLWQP